MSFHLCRLSTVAILLVASATASPSTVRRDGPVSVPAKLHMNSKGLQQLLQRDLARAKVFQTRYASQKSTGASFAQTPDLDVPIINSGTSFKAEVRIGTPGKSYELLVDTGSSNTVLSDSANYEVSPSSVNTTQAVKVKYGSGEFEGFESTDTVALEGASISQQSIGVAVRSSGLEDLDGLLGLGPTDLTRNTVDGLDTIPTVTDNLEQQGQISAAIVGFSVPPSTEPQTGEGSLEFGGPDSTKYTGDLTYIPITKTSPASRYWGIDQSISYGSGGTKILDNTAGIVDTGTSLVLLATDAFQAYVTATGAQKDVPTGLLRIDDADSLQSLFFNVGDRVFEFTANAQIWPRILNTPIGGQQNATYLIVGDLEKPSGQGMDFVCGLTFLQRFYSVYDTPNNRVGLATTSFTTATSN